ncbi:MAG: hemolysin family protein [Limnohabitans sp.]
MDVLLIVLLTFLNALFAMSEMALASSRRAVLVALAEENTVGSHAALELQQRPTEFLSTIQIGITTLGVLNGIIGEAAFSSQVAQWFMGMGVANVLAGVMATATVVTLITISTILFGELVPKRIGQIYPETAARLTAPAMLALSWMARPLVNALSWSTAAILRLMRIDLEKVRQVTEEEISASLVEGVDAGLIEKHEHQMVKNVFHLDERNLVSLMVPRTDIVWLDCSWTVHQAMAHIQGEAAHSWYPLCRDGLDEVVGVVSMATMLNHVSSDLPLETWVMPAAFVPETLSGLDLLSQFRITHLTDKPQEPIRSTRMVLVVDEYGVVQGLVTPRDLLEAITGELVQSTSPQDVWAVQRIDGSWLLDGLMPVPELKSRLDLNALPSEEKSIYNTLAGLIILLKGDLPQEGEDVEFMGWRFEVVDLDGRRIDKVLATQLPVNSADEDPTG